MLIPDQLVVDLGVNVVIWNIKGSEKKKVFKFRQTSSKRNLCDPSKCSHFACHYLLMVFDCNNCSQQKWYWLHIFSAMPKRGYLFKPFFIFYKLYIYNKTYLFLVAITWCDSCMIDWLMAMVGLREGFLWRWLLVILGSWLWNYRSSDNLKFG